MVKDVLLKTIQRLFGGQAASGKHFVSGLDVPNQALWRTFREGAMSWGWMGNPSCSHAPGPRKKLLESFRPAGKFFALLRSFKKESRGMTGSVPVEISGGNNPMLPLRAQLHMMRNDRRYANTSHQIRTSNQHIWDSTQPSGIPFLFVRDAECHMADMELTHFFFLCMARYPVLYGTMPFAFGIPEARRGLPGGPPGVAKAATEEPARSHEAPRTLLVHGEAQRWSRRSAYFDILSELLTECCRIGSSVHPRQQSEWQNCLRIFAEEWFDTTPIIRHHVPDAYPRGAPRPQLGPYTAPLAPIPDYSLTSVAPSNMATLQSMYLLLVRVLSESPSEAMNDILAGAHQSHAGQSPGPRAGGGSSSSSSSQSPSHHHMPSRGQRMPPLHIFHGPLYDHLRVVFSEVHKTQHSPALGHLDQATYDLEIECWLLWLQPWKIGSAQAAYVSQQWKTYVAGNLHFYTTLLGMFLRAQSRLPNTVTESSVAELQTLEKVLLCFSDQALVDDIASLARDFRLYYRSCGASGRPVEADARAPASIANAPASPRREESWSGVDLQRMLAAKWQHQQLYPALRYPEAHPQGGELLIEEAHHCGITDPFTDRESREGAQLLLRALQLEWRAQVQREQARRLELRERIPVSVGLSPETFWMVLSFVAGLGVFGCFLLQLFFPMFCMVVVLLAASHVSGGGSAPSTIKVAPRLVAAMSALCKLAGLEEAELSTDHDDSARQPMGRRRAVTINPHDGRSITDTHGRERDAYIFFHSRRFNVLEPDSARRHLYSCEFHGLANALIDASIRINTMLALPASFERKDDSSDLKDELLDIKNYPATWSKLGRSLLAPKSHVSWFHPRQKLLEICGLFRFNLRPLAHVRVASLLCLAAMYLLERPCVAALVAAAGLLPAAWVLSMSAALALLGGGIFLLHTLGALLGESSGGSSGGIVAYAQSVCVVVAAAAVGAFFFVDRADFAALYGPWARQQIYLLALLFFRSFALLPLWYMYENHNNAVDF